MGHVQDTPVSTSMISNVCMVYHMKVNIVSYNLDQIFFYKIHTLPNYEQTDLKTAIVTPIYCQFLNTHCSTEALHTLMLINNSRSHFCL